jgi:hypothetical protein
LERESLQVGTYADSHLERDSPQVGTYADSHLERGSLQVGTYADAQLERDSPQVGSGPIPLTRRRGRPTSTALTLPVCALRG